MVLQFYPIDVKSKLLTMKGKGERSGNRASNKIRTTDEGERSCKRASNKIRTTTKEYTAAAADAVFLLGNE